MLADYQDCQFLYIPHANVQSFAILSYKILICTNKGRVMIDTNANRIKQLYATIRPKQVLFGANLDAVTHHYQLMVAVHHFRSGCLEVVRKTLQIEPTDNFYADVAKIIGDFQLRTVANNFDTDWSILLALRHVGLITKETYDQAANDIMQKYVGQVCELVSNAEKTKA